MISHPRFVAGILLTAGLALGACGSDDTPADESATTTDAAVAVDATFNVSFDGSQCVAEGPAEVAPGEVSVLLVNDSDILVPDTAVRRLADGYTFQDMVDYAEGEEFKRRPNWVEAVPRLDGSLPEGVTLPLGYTYSTWLVGVDTEPGEHEIHLWSTDLWPCTGFVVTNE